MRKGRRHVHVGSIWDRFWPEEDGSKKGSNENWSLVGWLQATAVGLSVCEAAWISIRYRSNMLYLTKVSVSLREQIQCSTRASKWSISMGPILYNHIYLTQHASRLESASTVSASYANGNVHDSAPYLDE
jgi:hypothetical protein